MSSSRGPRGLLPLAPLLLLAFFLTSLPRGAECALVNPADGAIMMQLKAIYIGKFPDLASWNLNSDCSLWKRMMCWGSGKVNGIDLSGANVPSPVPEFLSGLDKLVNLNFNSAGWEGPVPLFVTAITGLQVLRIGGNKLTGELPSEWSSLTQLYKMNVAFNQLTGNVPTTWTRFAMKNGVAQGLQEFYADSNQLSGPFPTIVCEWPILDVLRIGGNPFTGTIPDCLGQKLPKLRKLYLDNIGPGLTGSIPPSIGGLTYLADMFLNGNALSGPIPESVGNMVSLQSMFLSGNQIEGPLPQSMGKLTELTQWTMEFNKIDGEIPKSIGDMVNCQRILLDNNLLTGMIPATIGKLKKLTILLLEGNFLYGPVPQEILTGCTSLVQFNVESNFLSGIPPGRVISNRVASGQFNFRSNIFSGYPSFTFANGTKFCPPFWPNSWIHSSVAFNCFQRVNSTGCKDNDKELTGQQHSIDVCTRACGANNPLGPCGGFGICHPSRTCICNPGYVAALDAKNISTCVLQASVTITTPVDKVTTLNTNVEGTATVLADLVTVADKAAINQAEVNVLQPAGAGTALKVETQVEKPGTCDLGDEKLCPMDIDCQDAGGLLGCACLSGASTAPRCIYAKKCLDQKACPVLARCLFTDGKTTCTCKSGYRPLMPAVEPNDNHFQFCAKTTCSENIEPFTGFNCFNDDSVQGK